MSKQAAPKVAIVLGSDSDWPAMQACREQLDEFGIAAEVRILSAHRTPQQVAEFASSAREAGYKVIIAAAGMAAALPGVIAAHTTLPVIGVPMASGSLGGLDALLSIAQMPPGVPVACLAVNGARNAAVLAAQIIGTYDSDVAEKVGRFKASLAEKVTQRDQALQDETAGP